MSQWFADEEAHGDAERVGDPDRLYGELKRTDLARHLAFFYRSPETQLDVAALFVRRALRTNNRCLYFVDSNTRADIETALRSAGIDVDARVDAGDLLIERGADAYRQADFDPTRLIALLEDACQESVAGGYDGLWVAGETTWHFHTDLSYDHVVDFEADFDAVCPDIPVTALCQYDLNDFCENSVAKALWTHRQVIYRYTICENPFYIPPEEFRSGAERPLNTQLMLEQAYNLAGAKQQIERREQRLAVVNRVLRHNIRNELNIARGVLDLIRETECLDAENRDRLETARDRTERVVEIADKARYVEQTIGQSVVRRAQITEFVTDAIDRIESTYPDVEISATGGSQFVVADTNLDIALFELLLYAVRSQEREPPRVSVVVSQPSSEDVRVELSYPGPAVSDNERRVLERGSETQLKHCNGLGLWLAKWIVENGHGRLAFPEDADHQIRLVLKNTRE